MKMKNLFILCFLIIIKVYSDGQSDRDSTTQHEAYSFAVGMINQKEEGRNRICTSSKPQKGYNYFVTDYNGRLIGKVDSFEKDSMDSCGPEDWLEIWNINLKKHVSVPFITGPYQYLIIQTKYELRSLPYNYFKKLDDFPIDDLLKLTDIKDIRSSSCLMSLYCLGRTEKITRYGIALFNGYPSSSRILIIDVSQKSSSIIFNGEIQSGKSFEQLEISNMTDLNKDGFADTFIIDAGDYGGVYILNTSSGEWKIYPATPYNPC